MRRQRADESAHNDRAVCGRVSFPAPDDHQRADQSDIAPLHVTQKDYISSIATATAQGFPSAVSMNVSPDEYLQIELLTEAALEQLEWLEGPEKLNVRMVEEEQLETRRMQYEDEFCLLMRSRLGCLIKLFASQQIDDAVYDRHMKSMFVACIEEVSYDCRMYILTTSLVAHRLFYSALDEDICQIFDARDAGAVEAIDAIEQQNQSKFELVLRGELHDFLTPMQHMLSVWSVVDYGRFLHAWDRAEHICDTRTKLAARYIATYERFVRACNLHHATDGAATCHVHASSAASK
jgi:hypothetical protein